MNILAVAGFPVEAAATRYRLAQFVDPLAKKGINLTISPFLNAKQFERLYKKKSLLQGMFEMSAPILHRVSEIPKLRDYDLLFVQREAMMFGPAIFEFLFQRVGNLPLILDLDDATYIPYISPTYGKLGSFFKFFGKTDRMIKRSDAVICGNRYIAEYVEKKGVETIVIPTVVDTDVFVPVEKNNPIPIIGWVGTHSTFPLLQSIFPVLQKLARKHRFILKIVGAGREHIELEGVAIENLSWNLERELADFQSLDIGLYPVTASATHSNDYILGKSGFKAIQYMALGIPFVMTPIGVCAEIGDPGASHFNASDPEDWYNALDQLLADVNLRRRMGGNARKASLRDFTVKQQFEKLENTIRKVYENR